jgi:hypothetical protein
LELDNITFKYVLKQYIEGINLQAALVTIMHLAEELAITQCRAIHTKWSVIIFMGTHRLMVLRMVEQLILLLKTLIRNGIEMPPP